MGFWDILTELSSRIDLQKLRGFPVPFPRRHTMSFQCQYDVVSTLKRRHMSTGALIYSSSKSVMTIAQISDNFALIYSCVCFLHVAQNSFI